MFGGDQDNVSSAAGVRVFVVLGAVVLFGHLSLNFFDFLNTLFFPEEVVHPEEGFLEGVFVLALLVVLILL